MPSSTATHSRDLFFCAQGYAAAISIICFILSVIPIIIIAYTNGFVDIILTTVRNSSLDDYEIIGGRERWLTYIGGETSRSLYAYVGMWKPSTCII